MIVSPFVLMVGVSAQDADPAPVYTDVATGVVYEDLIRNDVRCGDIKPTGPLPPSVDFPLVQQDGSGSLDALVFADPSRSSRWAAGRRAGG